MSAYDVAIIGAGIIGSSIAFELAREKLRVVVLDRQEPGREASWAAAGILSPAPESPAAIAMVPLGRANLALYPDFISAIEEASGESAGFRSKGTLQVFFAGDAERELSTVIALHHGLGLAAEALRVEEACELEPALSARVLAAALRPDEAAVDNRALTRAAILAARHSGADFRPGVHVNELLREGRRCTGVAAGGERIAANDVVLAAGCYSGEIAGASAYAPVRPARGQMVALRAPGVKIERVLWSERVYIVPRDDGRLVAGSTVEYVGFEKGVTPAGLQEILSATMEMVPALKNAAIEETWSGLRPDSPDHLPILGPTDVEGFAVATGHFRSGILLAPVTAKLIREWITEKSVSQNWEAFSPMRFLESQRATAERDAQNH